MKTSIFFTSREKAKNLLNKYDLLSNSYFIDEKISNGYIDHCRKKNFYNAYMTAIKNFDYHLLLFDESFFQFEYNKNNKKVELRYAFFQFPFKFPSYKEYLNLKNLSFNLTGYKLKDDYEQELNEAPRKTDYAIIRYDYSEKEYSHGVHSVSHFHIGRCDSIRISSYKLVTPLLFVIFILKQVYYDIWNQLITNPKFLGEYKGLKSKCDDIKNYFFKGLDKEELFLT